MASFKKFLLDYTLYIIFAAALMRFIITYRVGGDYRTQELLISSGMILLILTFIYIQWDAQRNAATQAGDLRKTNRDIAKAIKHSSDARQNISDKSREFAEVAVQSALEKQASAEHAAQISEKANQAKSDFLANMSHEIRTPMNAIIGLTHILQTTNLDTQQKQCVDVLQASADGLMRLINDLLDIDKMESGDVVLEDAPFSMTALIDQVVSVMSVRAKQKNVNLIVHYEYGLYKTYIGDSGRIRQILLNLVGNAVKFTEAKGKVSVLFANGGKGDGKMAITITVNDTGIGIPEDKINLIFDKFVQADSSITRTYGGTGLGLAISQALAKRMGGEITVTSIVGKGSSFVLHLNLPVRATENDAEKHYQENIIYLDMQANAGRQPILLVEDYEPNVLVATIMFNNFGYRYEVARNGKEAIERILHSNYSIVFMDVEMPVMDGFETTKRIRELEKTKVTLPVPIIAMTAHAMNGDREKCLSIGMNDYIAKPFNPHQLQMVLSKYSQLLPQTV
jgi:signal transduction histidine kinase/AmiR/NasT family two-component response regulator